MYRLAAGRHVPLTLVYDAVELVYCCQVHHLVHFAANACPPVLLLLLPACCLLMKAIMFLVAYEPL